MRFFLGSHKPNWLADPRFTNVPLFISRQMLTKKRKLPRALGPWALDSGGFTELQKHGRWTITPRAYAAEVRRFRDDIGNLDWAAPQDWMCEPQVLAGNNKTGPGRFEGTHKSIEEHQRLTVENYLELRSIAPDLPFVPVLQGWTLGDYWRCMDLYEEHGVVLANEPIVGIGTMCRRQATEEATRILATVASSGVKLHGFGFKVLGLRTASVHLASADSLAWSFTARHRPPMPGHDRPGGPNSDRPRGHKNCANCAEYAINWRANIIAAQAERESNAALGR